MQSSLPIATDPADDGLANRRARILSAAARCFVRGGFHRTTMVDVAREAGMSPGNLYRYFPSKSAIVAGLAERDRDGMRQELAAMLETGDFVSALGDLGRRHFRDITKEKAVLCLEIWAEATRDADICALNADYEAETLQRLTALFTAARSEGKVDSRLDPHAAASILALVVDGFYVRLATCQDFNRQREIAHVFAIVNALLRGEIAPTAMIEEQGSTS